MATKKAAAAPSMNDVTSPDKVTPSASGRPIIVSNHSVLPNDPMVVSDDDKSTAGAAPTSAPVINRQAKTIIPISHDIATESESPSDQTDSDTVAGDHVKTDSEKTPTATPSKKAAVPEAKSAEPKAEEAKPATTESDTPPEKADDEAADDDTGTEGADQDAGTAAKENGPEADKKLAAVEARERELEALIESGKYAIPINAERYRRSKLTWLLWSLLVLVIVVVVLDLLLDAGILSLPIQVPHTHFLDVQTVNR